MSRVDLWSMKQLIATKAVLSTLTLALLWTPMSWAKVQYTSDQLYTKNFDEMATLIKRRLKKAENIQSQQETEDYDGLLAEPDALAALKDGVRIALSRSDQDGSRSYLFGELRRELLDLNSLELVLDDLKSEAIAALRSDRTPVSHKATYVVFLENLMAEIKPDLNKNPAIQSIIADIRDANIEISDKLKVQQRLRAMSQIISPSEIAARILPKKKPLQKSVTDKSVATALDLNSKTN